MDSSTGHRPFDDALPLPRPVPVHAASVSGRTSMAEQPGTTTPWSTIALFTELR